MTGEGEIIKIASKEYPLYMNDEGWSEQSPEDWWNGVCLGIKELISDIDNTKIKAISFSGQMHGLVTLDNNDQVIRPAILWNDQRTQKQCDTLNALGIDKLIDYTANIALTGFTAPKILWMKENEPELFSKIDKIMLPKDYIAYKLSGIHATDVSDASGMLLLDVKNRKWSNYMLDILGINENQLPKLFESYECIGNLTSTAAGQTGLTTNTKVVIGGGDQAVGAVGTGTVSNNMCSISLGTSGVVFVASDDFKVKYGKDILHSFCDSTGKYHMMGVTLSAAGSNKWWMEEILNTKDNKQEQKDIENLGKNKVFFLPYLSGERSPHNDPKAKGAFIGLSMTTKRCDMTQAVLEGVAFSLRDSLETVRNLGIDVKSVRIIGGGAKSELWRKIIANIFNTRVEIINSEEGPAFGAAILAAVGDKKYTSVEQATTTLITVKDFIDPNEELVHLYNERYEVYKKLYPSLKDTFSMI
jgi:xylulokinase